MAALFFQTLQSMNILRIVNPSAAVVLHSVFDCQPSASSCEMPRLAEISNCGFSSCCVLQVEKNLVICFLHEPEIFHEFTFISRILSFLVGKLSSLKGQQKALEYTTFFILLTAGKEYKDRT